MLSLNALGGNAVKKALATSAKHALNPSSRYKVTINSVDKTNKRTKLPETLDPSLYARLAKKPECYSKYFPKAAVDPRDDLDGLDKLVSDPSCLELAGQDPTVPIVATAYQGHIKMPHPLWTQDECDNVEITHEAPHGVPMRLAWTLVWFLRRAFDIVTGYTLGFKSDACMLRRITILETVAGIPGMVGGALRHFRSLRTGCRDYGWIHSLIEEAENERMHLLIAMSLHDPNRLVRFVIKCGQMLILPFYTTAYMISPKFCHHFVGYIEEEAVKTYTQILDLIDQGKLPSFETLAPPAARQYYHLPEGVTMRDIIANIRADEAHHRELNHCLAKLQKTEVNPFGPGY